MAPTNGIPEAKAKALAPFTEIGLTIVRHLLREKISGQAQVLRTGFADRKGTAAAIEEALAGVDEAETYEDLRGLEAEAATAYWSGWRGLTMMFARKDAARVLPRWIAFESRASLVTGKPRLATDPIGALLNIAYGPLEC
jgi:CRISPR/Cas system-associated endonuclease Cas1